MCVCVCVCVREREREREREWEKGRAGRERGGGGEGEGESETERRERERERSDNCSCKKKRQKADLLNLVGELLQLQDEKTPRIFYRCRWTATDFNQKATGVLLQAMITCDTLSTGFGDKVQTSEKAVHTPGRRPRTTLAGFVMYAFLVHICKCFLTSPYIVIHYDICTHQLSFPT